MQINSLNHFRAIAILFIVTGHFYEITGMGFNSLFDITLKNLISGGTSLFVFISGFLFHHVFYPRFVYKEFMLKKVSTVLLPYLILSFTPVLLDVLIKTPVNSDYFLPTGEGVFKEYIIPFFKYLFTGGCLWAYWYIPFIMVTFALSPFHVKYIKLNPFWQLALICILSLISIFIHRPISNISVLQSVVYYTPVYLIGITASIHKEYIYTHMKSLEWYFLGLAILLAASEAYLGYQGNYHKNPFDYNGIDLMYLQKLALCLFFMLFLHRFENFDNKVIYYLRTTSFAVFFLHPFINKYLFRLHLNILKQDSWLFLFVFSLLVTTTCILAAITIKKLFPRYSKYIIGY